MKYPNLKVALSQKRIPQFVLAQLLRMSEGTFSLRMNGRAEFAPHEKTRIAEFLGFDADWLFTEAYIPASARHFYPRGEHHE